MIKAVLGNEIRRNEALRSRTIPSEEIARLGVTGATAAYWPKKVAELEEDIRVLKARNATLEAIVTQRAQSNATRQKAYRERRKAAK